MSEKLISLTNKKVLRLLDDKNTSRLIKIEPCVYPYPDDYHRVIINTKCHFLIGDFISIWNIKGNKKYLFRVKELLERKLELHEFHGVVEDLIATKDIPIMVLNAIKDTQNNNKLIQYKH